MKIRLVLTLLCGLHFGIIDGVSDNKKRNTHNVKLYFIFPGKGEKAGAQL